MAILHTMIRRTARPIRARYRYMQLPAAARAERHKDRLGLPAQDPGIERAIDEGVAWLARAQDASASADGGVARHYSLIACLLAGALPILRPQDTSYQPCWHT
jgi:hypothetical protein